MSIHHSITLERVLETVEEARANLADPGFCHACGVDVYSVEPDARDYECESCGAQAVHGAEETLFMVSS